MGIVTTIFLLLLSFLAWSGGGMTLDVNKNEKSFNVSLAANPTTGYSWSVLDYDKNLLSLTHSEYNKPQTNLIGAGGVMIFTFTLNEGKTYPSQTKMTFRYSRPWEQEGGKIKKVVVRFNDKPNTI